MKHENNDLPPGKPIVSFDFDGVIFSYLKGWQGATVIDGPPVQGALQALAEYSQYFDIAIFSSRSHQRGGIKAMKEYLYDAYLDIVGVISKRSWFGLREELSVKPMTTRCTPSVPGWFQRHILTDLGRSIEPWYIAVAAEVKNFIEEKIDFPKIKPPAFFMFDDRCCQFNGIFPDPLDVANFKTWYRRDNIAKDFESKISEQDWTWIYAQLDNTGGILIKESELERIIERFVKDTRERMISGRIFY